MKKMIALAILLSVIATTSFGQVTKNPKQQLTREEYLKKSKGQRTAAWILLGAGVISIASVSSGNSSFDNTSTFAIIGGVAIVSSIPLFIAAGKNKKRGMAASAGLNFQRVPENQFAISTHHYVPALTLKMNF